VDLREKNNEIVDLEQHHTSTSVHIFLNLISTAAYLMLQK